MALIIIQNVTLIEAIFGIVPTYNLSLLRIPIKHGKEIRNGPNGD